MKLPKRNLRDGCAPSSDADEGLRRKGNVCGVESSIRLLRYFVVVFFAGLLAGCASTSETTTIQENLSILNQRQAAIETRLQNIEGASQKKR